MWDMLSWKSPKFVIWGWLPFASCELHHSNLAAKDLARKHTSLENLQLSINCSISIVLVLI